MIQTKPAITGDTAKGRSIKEMRSALPLNRYLVTSHAADRPNRVFRGTETPAAMSVSLTAENAASSVSDAKNTSHPRRNASAKTAKQGQQ